MADIADIANDRAEEQLSAALAKQVGKSAPEWHADFNGTDCIACEEPIPAGRLALGKIRCVPCQSQHETRKRLGLA